MSYASDIGTFDKCTTCGEYGWIGGNSSRRHYCPPIYECRMVENDDELRWTNIHESDAEDAAEKFATRWFWDGGYEGFGGGEIKVEVRKLGTTEIEIFEVTGEPVMQFSAREGDKEEAVEDAERATTKAVALALVAIPLALMIEDPKRRQYVVGWDLASKLRRAAFHYEHLCELRGIEPGSDDAQDDDGIQKDSAP